MFSPCEKVLLCLLMCVFLGICQKNKELTAKKQSIKTYVDRSHCDDNSVTKGWYRFSGDAGAGMATSCAPMNYCGVSYPGWMNGSHPTADEGIVTRTVCFDCKCYNKTQVTVARCNSFYIYQLVSVPNCKFGYCGNGRG